ncbi:MAG TPA: gluconokinase [Burkholderiales bacterium]|nr:gluconokinase [Burkholderiales bacterium]
MTIERDDAKRAAITVIVIMGVSGSGKTAIGALLAGMLHWEFADADDFHPESNILKMASGIPLGDEDRWPWLHAIAAWIDAHRAKGTRGVVTCSALKRRYRDILIGDRRDVALVYLQGEKSLIARRMAKRHEHFMPVALLQSQLDTLEEPGLDEHPVVVSIDAPPLAMATEIVRALDLPVPTSGA